MLALGAAAILLLSTYLAARRYQFDTQAESQLAIDHSGSVVHDYSAHTLIGERPYQEDRVVTEVLPGDRFLVLAVCDGHGGAECSEFLQKRLGKALAKELPPQVEGELGRRIYRACMLLHSEWNDRDDGKMLKLSGSTLTGLVVDLNNPDKCYTFNLGDSKTILYGLRTHRSTETRSHDLSPPRIAQVRRRDPEATLARDEHGVLRLMGHGTGLNLSGAFGNTHDPKLHQSLLKEVEVSVHVIDEPTQVVIASDGLEDFSTKQVIRLIIEEHMNAAQLADHANRYGPKGDNISCILLRLGA